MSSSENYDATTSENNDVEPTAGEMAHSAEPKPKPPRALKKNFSFGNTANVNYLRFLGGRMESSENVTEPHKNVQEKGPDQSDTDEEAPLIEKPDKTSQIGAGMGKTMVSIFKAFVGTGVIFLPKGFYYGGTVFSSVILAIIAFMATWCIILLIACWKVKPGSFGDIGENAFGKWGKILVDISIVATQVGVGCVYMVFIAEQIEVIWHTDLAWLILVQVPFLIPLVWIRHVYKLSVANFLGSVFILIVLGYIIVEAIILIADNGPKPTEPLGGGVLIMFGTAIYAFEGIATMIPILQSMKKKEDFLISLNISMVFITFLMIFFGLICYLAWGDEIESPVTLNLDSDQIHVKILLLAYGAAIFFSYPLILFPAWEILQNWIFPVAPQSTKRTWMKNIFRAVIVAASSGIAIIGGADLDYFVAVIGGLCCTPLALIFPAFFHWKLFDQTLLFKVLDFMVGVIGVVLCLFVTAYSLYEWIAKDADGAL